MSASTSSPVASTYPRWAIESAMFAFCSTISIATPVSLTCLRISEILLDERGGETHRRLVHQQHPRPRHQRSPDRDHLLLAARERPRELLEPLVHAREQLEHALVVGCQVLAALSQRRAELEVLAHRQLPEQAAVLGHDRETSGDPGGYAEGVDLLAVEHHAAAARAPAIPEDRLQRRRLSGGVAPEQTYELARVDLERDPPEDPHLPVIGRDVLERQQRRPCRRLGRCCRSLLGSASGLRPR